MATVRTRLRNSSLADFLHAESSGGVVLLVATVVALVLANSPLADAYDDFWHTDLRLGVGALSTTEDLRHWVNDGLMAVFFFVVGLEIKRELVVGELKDRKAAALPAIAALGGMVLPALVYTALNLGDGGQLRGWAIPMATDIAFCVGIMAALGDRVSSSLKLFLLTLAIIDDIGAIVVIALFYGEGISAGPALLSLGLLAGYGALQRRRLPGGWPVLALVGIAAWAALLASGIHATLAGVALGLLTRTDGHPDVEGPAERTERILHPYSSFLVVPIFALANAGLPLSVAAAEEALRSPVAIGVTLGLVLGKALGVLGATWVAARLGLGTLPRGVSWAEVAGVSALAGIGFTVSLFITTLAFEGSDAASDATIGILVGSVVAAVVGAAILARSARIEPGEV